MLTLILDTSTDYTLLALSKDDEFFAEYPSCVGRQSHHLLPSIEGFLKCHGLELSNLSQIAVGIGPGAYTGTRIGLTIAKALSYALKIPLLPFCSLKAFKPKREGPFTSIIDAKGGYIYTLEGTQKGTTISYSSSPALKKLIDIKNNNYHISPHACQLGAENIQTAWPDPRHLISQLKSFAEASHDEIDILYLKSI